MTYIDDPSRTPSANRAAAVTERARVFATAHQPPTLPPVPDIPASRYDLCTCGDPRLLHGPRCHAFELGEPYHPSWLNPHLDSAPEEGSR